MAAADRTRSEGYRLGFVRGYRDGRVRVLLRQIEGRFGPATDATLERLHKASDADLDLWVERVLFVGSLDDLFAP